MNEHYNLAFHKQKDVQKQQDQKFETSSWKVTHAQTNVRKNPSSSSDI